MATLSETMLAALESFAAEGVEITDAMREAIVRQQHNEMADAAGSVFEKKLVTVNAKNISKWTDRAFKLASDVYAEIVSEERNVQGRGIGTRTVRAFTVETPNGRLEVKLSE